MTTDFKESASSDWVLSSEEKSTLVSILEITVKNGAKNLAGLFKKIQGRDDLSTSEWYDIIEFLDDLIDDHEARVAGEAPCGLLDIAGSIMAIALLHDSIHQAIEEDFAIDRRTYENPTAQPYKSDG